MITENKRKNKILIADDSEFNRSILIDILGNDFDIIEASNGLEAVSALQANGTEIDLVLLDIVMPEMDGFEVLTAMNRHHWIDDIPVIMISTETASSYVERAYELGVTDFISRPFNASIVYKRVINTIILDAKQKKLINLVSDSIYEKEKSNRLMVTILSHIVEFRNGESGLHVLHINTITSILLACLMRKTDKYKLSQFDISMITIASALHDIGKICIPEEILNKPGRLTNEEFAIMKTHTSLGASMLDELVDYHDEALIKYAYEICRWHHERYDGKGYPDGLVGDDIPIGAQVVSIADVYDALTSERCYKKAFSHEVAMQMILNGECGTFNPILLECLKDCQSELIEGVSVNSVGAESQREMRKIATDVSNYDDLGLSTPSRTIRLLEHECTKFRFLCSVTREITFEYTIDPAMLIFPENSANLLGVEQKIINPSENESIKALITEDTFNIFSKQMGMATPENPVLDFYCVIVLQGTPKNCRIICQTLWSSEEEDKRTGMIGKIFPEE